ncbi:MAG TPA: class I SAM-dependent methyltransferase [Syntrophorhabdaceae bacterium]|nr:class I SAM-dependent methyltransferase [Syntrophorhabdaceae bacterium]
MTNKDNYYAALSEWKKLMDSIPDSGAGAYLKLLNVVTVSQLLHEFESGEIDPYPGLAPAFRSQSGYMDLYLKFPIFNNSSFDGTELKKGLSVKELYETAWTSYSESTYDHSLDLIHRRLKANGMDTDFFKGKKCLDGGCGTGRFAIAMAQLGADKSVGIDIGTRSLEFANRQKERLGLSNVLFQEMSADDLKFEDGYFDLVISNGVLHHIERTETGLSEHLRVLRSGGLFWLYLYGKGGLFWELYDVFKDSLKNISYSTAIGILRQFHIHENKFYLFSDNVYVPVRKYFSYSEVHAILAKYCEYSHELLKGATGDDDVKDLLSKPYGKEFWGDEGEVRLKIIKK